MAGKRRANWSTPLGADASSSSRPSSPGESGREAELKTFGSIEPEHCHHWLRATGAPLAEVIRHLVKHLNILVGRQRCQVSASTDTAHHRLNVIMIRARYIRRRFAAGASGKPGGHARCIQLLLKGVSFRLVRLLIVSKSVLYRWRRCCIGYVEIVRVHASLSSRNGGLVRIRASFREADDAAAGTGSHSHRELSSWRLTNLGDCRFLRTALCGT